MSDNEPAELELGSTAYELFIGALSILSLVDIVLLAVLRDEATQAVVYVLDFVLSVVFLIDFLVRLHRAPRAVRLLLPPVRLGRPRWRACRFPRSRSCGCSGSSAWRDCCAGTAPRNIGRSLLRDRAGSALLTLLLMGILVLEFGSLAMLSVERSAPDANIKTASTRSGTSSSPSPPSATATSTRSPTPDGCSGTLIIVVGVGIFGTLTGYLANLFLSPQKERPASETLRKRPRSGNGWTGQGAGEQAARRSRRAGDSPGAPHLDATPRCPQLTSSGGSGPTAARRPVG